MVGENLWVSFVVGYEPAPGWSGGNDVSKDVIVELNSGARWNASSVTIGKRYQNYIANIGKDNYDAYSKGELVVKLIIEDGKVKGVTSYISVKKTTIDVPREGGKTSPQGQPDSDRKSVEPTSTPPAEKPLNAPAVVGPSEQRDSSGKAQETFEQRLLRGLKDFPSGGGGPKPSSDTAFKHCRDVMGLNPGTDDFALCLDSVR